RFFSGYAAMFHTYAFVAETHMLKPYPQRVKATYELMRSITGYAGKNAEKIKETRKQQRKWIAEATSVAVDWAADTTSPVLVELKGYEAGKKPSDISGQPRLYYDRGKP